MRRLLAECHCVSLSLAHASKPQTCIAVRRVVVVVAAVGHLVRADICDQARGDRL